MTDIRYTPPNAPLDVAEPAPAATDARPIGGWLYLVGFGLIVSPFKVAFLGYANYWPIFRDGHWDVLTDPGSAAYHALWAPLVVAEIIGTIAHLVIGLITLVHFLKRTKKTPRWAIVWFAFGAAFNVLDLGAASMIPALASQSDAEAMKEVTRSIVAAAIWIPYFMVSTRVKETFVR